MLAAGHPMALSAAGVMSACCTCCALHMPSRPLGDSCSPPAERCCWSSQCIHGVISDAYLMPIIHPPLCPCATTTIMHSCRETGCRLLVFCVRRGWSHAAEKVLRVLLHSAGAPYPSVVVHATAQAGVSLLHLAVQSGHPSMVSALLRSGRAHFFTWPWNIPGPVGTTPLHVAAAAPGRGDIAQLALQTSPGGLVGGLQAPVMYDVLPPACRPPSRPHAATLSGCELVSGSWSQPRLLTAAPVPDV
jgi:hypothetical protein